MGLLVDSSVFIALERAVASGAQLEDVLLSLPEEPLEISAVTVGEMFAGMHRARTDEQRSAREAFGEQPPTR